MVWCLAERALMSDLHLAGRRCAAGHEPAVARERAERVLEHRAADVLEHHVRALLAGQGSHPAARSVAVWSSHLVGAERLRAARLGRAAAVAITRAPSSRAIWTAALPTPLPAPITSTSLARRTGGGGATSMCHAVRNTRGTRRACSHARFSGYGMQLTPARSPSRRSRRCAAGRARRTSGTGCRRRAGTSGRCRTRASGSPAPCRRAGRASPPGRPRPLRPRRRCRARAHFEVEAAQPHAHPQSRWLTAARADRRSPPRRARHDGSGTSRCSSTRDRRSGSKTTAFMARFSCPRSAPPVAVSTGGAPPPVHGDPLNRYSSAPSRPPGAARGRVNPHFSSTRIGAEVVLRHVREQRPLAHLVQERPPARASRCRAPSRPVRSSSRPAAGHPAPKAADAAAISVPSRMVRDTTRGSARRRAQWASNASRSRAGKAAIAFDSGRAGTRTGRQILAPRRAERDRRVAGSRCVVHRPSYSSNGDGALLVEPHLALQHLVPSQPRSHSVFASASAPRSASRSSGRFTAAPPRDQVARDAGRQPRAAQRQLQDLGALEAREHHQPR